MVTAMDKTAKLGPPRTLIQAHEAAYMIAVLLAGGGVLGVVVWALARSARH